MTTAFFVACALVFSWHILVSRPRQIIDDEGMLVRRPGAGVIKWHDIEAAYVFAPPATISFASSRAILRST